MAVENINDSYNRCIAELRSRYRGKAISNNAKHEAAALRERDMLSAGESTDGYVLFDSRSKIADSYRSGIYNGSRYMTSDDFVRYFRSRRAFYSPSAYQTADAEAKAAENSAVPARKNGASSSSLTPSESGSKESHIQGLIATVKKFANEWFPAERKEGRTEGRKFRLPVSAMAGIAVFAISMTLIVSGSVLVGTAEGEVGKLDSQIASLKAEKADIEGKLDLKYTVDQIEADAKAMGMIKRQYADNQYVTLEDDDEIVIYDDGKEENIGLSSLLSAFGVNPDD
ncbi:MAG: hypothetical protein E7678_01440 [Ruminococcaceae bacterium]|nr:hypothetical protein [Oscillospiraceae bacterium]